MMKLITKLVLPFALIMAPTAAYSALDETAADWVAAKAAASEFINVGPATDNLEMVNFLLCVMENSNMGDHVNETYSAMIDENICFGTGESTPAFATQTLVTSRASNTSDYLVTAYFVTAEGMQVVAKTVISQGPTTALPRGVFTMTWNALMGSDSNTPSGAGGELTAAADGTISYVEKMYSDTNNLQTSYIHGELNSDGSGNLRVQSGDWANPNSDGDPTPTVYAFVSDTNSVHYDTVPTSSVQCMDRSAATMEKRTHQYKLFTAAGVEHVIAYPPFSFSYTDASSNSRRGWAGDRDVWLEGGETGSDRPTSVVNNSNDKTYSTCFEDSDNGTCANNGKGDEIYYTFTHADDGAYVTTAALEFGNIVDFTDTVSGSAVTGASAWSNRGGSNFGRYDGPGSNLGLNMECKISGVWTAQSGSNCDGKNNWRPAYGLPDATELDASGTKYYTMAMDSSLGLADESSTAVCTNVNDLLLTTDNYPAVKSAYTVTNVASTTLWTDRPTEANGGLTAANVMKVIHGVEQ
jgi:hypothetical protein